MTQAKRRMKRVQIYFEIEGTFEEITERFKAIRKEHPGYEYFELEWDRDYNHERTLVCYGCRMETDDEAAAREASEDALRSATEQRERTMLAHLQAKYGDK